MTIAEYIFGVCLFLVLYTYLLYPILLFLAYPLWQARRDWHYLRKRLNRRAALRTEELPTISLIVPAYNEESCLWDKIANIRQLDYPQDRLEVVFVSDGSSDRTNEILGSLGDPNIRTLLLPARQGKANALNEGVARSRHEILLLSDASTLFAPDAPKKLVRHFSDPRVGVVCGALEFRGTAESRQTEGIYWKYESMLRLMEGRLGATLTASGAMYALRRQCYRPLPLDALIDDFLVCMNVRRLGYNVVYEPESVATEFAPESVEGEFVRRIRIALGSFRALGELVRLPLDVTTCVALLSHKILRWILPFLLVALLVSNALLLSRPLYQVTFVGQLLFYLWAVAGWAFRQRLGRVRFGLLGYFLLAIHVAFLVGFWRFLMGRGASSWERVG